MFWYDAADYVDGDHNANWPTPAGIWPAHDGYGSDLPALHWGHGEPPAPAWFIPSALNGHPALDIRPVPGQNSGGFGIGDDPPMRHFNGQLHAFHVVKTFPVSGTGSRQINITFNEPDLATLFSLDYTEAGVGISLIQRAWAFCHPIKVKFPDGTWNWTGTQLRPLNLKLPDGSWRTYDMSGDTPLRQKQPDGSWEIISTAGKYPAVAGVAPTASLPSGMGSGCLIEVSYGPPLAMRIAGIDQALAGDPYYVQNGISPDGTPKFLSDDLFPPEIGTADVQLCELIMYSGRLTGPALAARRQYFADKYGIPT